jgi:hypothetical protein
MDARPGGPAAKCEPSPEGLGNRSRRGSERRRRGTKPMCHWERSRGICSSPNRVLFGALFAILSAGRTPIWAVSASRVTACSPLQVVLRGKDHVRAVVVVILSQLQPGQFILHKLILAGFAGKTSPWPLNPCTGLNGTTILQRPASSRPGGPLAKRQPSPEGLGKQSTLLRAP